MTRQPYYSITIIISLFLLLGIGEKIAYGVLSEYSRGYGGKTKPDG